MKNQNPLTKLALLLAVLLTLGAARAQADILPGVSIGFAPVGITMDQTARLNLVNIDVPNGMFINWRFIDEGTARNPPSTDRHSFRLGGDPNRSAMGICSKVIAVL